MRTLDQPGTAIPTIAILQRMLEYSIVINLVLMAFNLIPLPPLDGSRILAAFLPPFWQPYLANLERYGFAILLVLILFGSALGGVSVISAIVAPVYNLLFRTLTGV